MLLYLHYLSFEMKAKYICCFIYMEKQWFSGKYAQIIWEKLALACTPKYHTRIRHWWGTRKSDVFFSNGCFCAKIITLLRGCIGWVTPYCLWYNRENHCVSQKSLLYIHILPGVQGFHDKMWKNCCKSLNFKWEKFVMYNYPCVTSATYIIALAIMQGSEMMSKTD